MSGDETRPSTRDGDQFTAPTFGPPATSQVFYLADGEPFEGTVGDYTRAHQLSHHLGATVPDVVWTWDVVLTPDAPGGASWGWTDHPVDVETSLDDEDGRRVVALRLLGQQVRYWLDAGG